MTEIELHQYVKRSVQDVIPARYERDLRHLLESVGCEGFLRDLLAMELTGPRADPRGPLVYGSADLVLVQSGFFIEAKQLHLNDGTRWITNILRDLRRHDPDKSLGVVYLLDERLSRSTMHFERFGGQQAGNLRRCEDDRRTEGIVSRSLSG
jgi:hypothetical protein